MSAVLFSVVGCSEEPDEGPWPELESGLETRTSLDCVNPDAFTSLLSEHPCFEGTPPMPKTGFVPYTVRNALWSDGLRKDRYVGIPDGELIEPNEDGTLELPVGSAIIKIFRDGTRLVETRILATWSDASVHAATYVWNEEGTDATLTDDGTTIEITGGTWKIPTAAQCFNCHVNVANVFLGLRIDELNGNYEYEATGRTANQIATWVNIGLLDATNLERPDALSALAAYNDENNTDEERARSYLDSNCAHCHRPGANGAGSLDLRASTPLNLAGIVDVSPMFGDPWDGEGTLVASGDPDRSLIVYRMSSPDQFWRMPPVGTAQVDAHAVEFIRNWITGLPH